MSETDFISASGKAHEVLKELLHVIRDNGGNQDDLRQLLKDDGFCQGVAEQIVHGADLSRWIETVVPDRIYFTVDYEESLEHAVRRVISGPSVIIQVAAEQASKEFAAQFAEPRILADGPNLAFEGVLFWYRPPYFWGWPDLMGRMIENGYLPADAWQLFAFARAWEGIPKEHREVPIVAGNSSVHGKPEHHPFVIGPDRQIHIGHGDEDEELLQGKVLFLGVRKLTDKERKANLG